MNIADTIALIVEAEDNAIQLRDSLNRLHAELAPLQSVNGRAADCLGTLAIHLVQVEAWCRTMEKLANQIRR